MDVRPAITNLVGLFTKEASAEAETEPITVSAATRRIAHVYERFRNTLEPEEEDLLRRKAIFRILERRLAEDQPPQVMAEQLLQELIRGNYIAGSNKRCARAVALRLIRTHHIRRHLSTHVDRWFLHLVAVSIDRDLYLQRPAEAVVSLMYKDMYRRTEWVDTLVAEAERATQLYIGCHRALFEADDYEIAYHYFIHEYPAWQAATFTQADLNRLIKELPAFYRRSQALIHHPARDRIRLLLRPMAVPYRIVRDLAHLQPQAFESEEQLESATREAVHGRSRHIRGRMNKRAWHSILFLLFTKTILALLIEVPYEVFLLGEFHVLALLVNVSFHPSLLLLMASTARLPGGQNTERIVTDVHKIVRGEDSLAVLIMNRARHYGASTWTFFTLVYAVLFWLIFWGLFSVLTLLGFSLVAMFIFVMFLGLVSFLATRIRRSVNDIRMEPKHEGAVSLFFTFVSLPILEFGRWLTQHINQINIALFFMDRILEAPFKILIDVVEEWFTFVKDRREEIT